ncbi:MAG: DUF4381 domain-containing protein [Gammaproteobacteria bacterium]|jgi:hypothetical protein|nr:DUF4381 domain-containing protein [Gammaproteobacteria bacterium]
MNPLLQELRDIRGLDPLPWWPPAPGWWLVLVAVLLLATAATLAVRWWRNRVPGSWQADARIRLRQLEDRLRWADARTMAAELSELLRRMAMARHGRRACAGLVGEGWLDWLERHDPAGFPWRTKGRPLIDLPYAPPRLEGSADRLRPLIRAARTWLAPEPHGDDHPLGAEASVAHAAVQRAALGGRDRV